MNLRTTLCWLALALCTNAASSMAQVPTAPAAQLPTAPAAQNGLRSGDILRIVVWRNPELSGEFAVAEDGGLVHPLYREVRVANQPIAVVEQRIREFLSRYESSPQFAVEPLYRVYVSGEVRQPNRFNLRPETTVSEALAQAGGPTERAALRQVRLIRGGQMRLLDLSDPSGIATQEPIRSGDQIVLVRRRDVFREYVAPVATLTGTVLSLANLVLRLRS